MAMKRWAVLGAAGVAAISFGALAIEGGVAQQESTPEVVCDADTETVSLALQPGSEDRVTPGWRARDGAIRVRFVSKGSVRTEGDRTCTSPDVQWSRVAVGLDDLSDETTQFGINRQFRHLPETVRFFVEAGEGDFDEIRGYEGSDRLDGGGGRDELRGYGGRDRVIGGAGEDDLFAGGQADVIEAADGESDFVRCGYGQDTALVDRLDDVQADCERIREPRE